MKRIIFISIILIVFLSITTVCADEWVCPVCSKTNTTKFCTSCGAKHEVWICQECGTENTDTFCGECGTAKPFDISVLFGAWEGDTNIDSYFIFRENGTMMFMLNTGELLQGTYTATADKLTVTLNDRKAQATGYNIVANQLTIENIGTFTKAEKPVIFSLSMDGESMADTIYHGTKVYFACKDTSEIQRFDIVATYFPNRGSTIFIKRVVGLPGDIVELRDGYLYINNEEIEEDYINDEYRIGIASHFGPYTVPEGQYFVLGDHRNHSNDSRFIGPLEAEMIIGVMTVPPDVDIHIGRITEIH